MQLEKDRTTLGFTFTLVKRLITWAGSQMQKQKDKAPSTSEQAYLKGDII